MDKILSQDEINALFSAMSAGESNPEEKQTKKNPARRKITNFNFHGADRISQDQMHSVYLLHESFARNLTSSLSAYLRNSVDVTLVNLEQVSYSAFLKTLPDPTLFSRIGMKPLGDNLALEMNPSLVFPMIDMILGGPGNAQTGNRNLTEIELNIIDGVLGLSMRALSSAWDPIKDFDFFIEDKGTKAQMLQIISPGETVIAVHLELAIGDSTGMMNLCIPSRILKQLRKNFDRQWDVQRQRTGRNEEKRIMDIMKQIPIPLSGEIMNSKLTINDLLKVSVGDVIELEKRIEDPAYLCADGIPKYAGKIAQVGGKRVFEISRNLSADS